MISFLTIPAYSLFIHLLFLVHVLLKTYKSTINQTNKQTHRRITEKTNKNSRQEIKKHKETLKKPIEE